MSKNVLLLQGGLSAERAVSFASGKPVQNALESSGYRVVTFDPDWDVAQTLPLALQGIDVVFNALHGKWGEDGNIQGILNFAKVPYTHSGVLASSLAMDKPLSKIVFPPQVSQRLPT